MFLACSIALYLVLGLLIHELGHFAAARLTRVTAKELALGLGPRLLGFRIGSVAFNLRALPLGSFLRLDGSELAARSLSQQLFVHLGGVLANALFGFAFFGSFFGFLNLFIAAGNVLPIYQHDGWKCGLVLMRGLLRKRSRPVEWTYTFSGVVVSVLVVYLVIRLGI